MTFVEWLATILFCIGMLCVFGAIIGFIVYLIKDGAYIGGAFIAGIFFISLAAFVMKLFSP